MHSFIYVYRNCLLFRSTWVHPQCLVEYLLLDLYFYVFLLQIVVFPFILFLLAIVLSVRLRFTYSDDPFGIFKLFLQVNRIRFNRYLDVYYFIMCMWTFATIRNNIRFDNCRFTCTNGIYKTLNCFKMNAELETMCTIIQKRKNMLNCYP